MLCICKQKQFYQACSKLKDALFYLAGNLTWQQQNVFYKCCMLRKLWVITSTYNLYLHPGWCAICGRNRRRPETVKTQKQQEDMPFATPQTSPAPSVSVVPGVSSEDSVHRISSLQLFMQSEITATQGFEVNIDGGREDSDEPPEQQLPTIPPEQLHHTEPRHQGKSQIDNG